MIDRLFFHHPRLLGMSWFRHGAGALLIAAKLIGAGLACLVHALVPGWFTETAGRTVESLHGAMLKRRAGGAGQEQWLDYEI